jgi:putative tryptophan/tyrosine transport system substrate-binding protein
MKRRDLMAGFAGCSAMCLLPRRSPAASAVGGVPHVGILDPGSPGGYSDKTYWPAFREAMRALGYRDGAAVAYDERWAEGDGSRLIARAAELAALPVRVIVATSTTAALAARSATSDIPIVAPLMADPIGAGLAASLNRPGGNVTGLTTLSAELSAKRLEILKEMVPALTRAAILWEDANPAFAITVRETEAAAHRLGIAIAAHGLKAEGGIEAALHAIEEDHVQGVIVAIPAGGGGSSARDPRALATRLAHLHLPATFAERAYVEAGGLLSYGPDYPDLFRRAASYVDKIIEGAKPGDLPVEEPTRFQLAINIGVAKTLGVAIPQSVLARADEVVE